MWFRFIHLFLRQVFEKEDLQFPQLKNPSQRSPPIQELRNVSAELGVVPSGTYTTLSVGDPLWDGEKRDPFKAWLVTPNDPVMKKGHDLNHLALFRHDFLLGGIFLGVLLNGKLESFTTIRCRVCRAKRGVTMTSHDVEAAMQELSPKLLLGKEEFSVKCQDGGKI